jgi:predicted PurR-regulated permease PerM
MPVQTGVISVILAAAAFLALREAAPVVVPVLVSGLCAYALEPAVARLISWRIPRPAAAVIVYVALAVALALGIRAVGSRIAIFTGTLPSAIAKMQQLAAGQTSSSGALGRLQQTAKTIEQSAAASAPAPEPGVARVLVTPRLDVREYFLPASRSLFAASLQATAVASMTFLLLATGDLYKRKLLKLAGPRLTDRRITIEIINSIDRQIERYLVVRVLISGIVAAATTAALVLIGVDNALVWGLVAGALNVLPYFGPGLACVLIALAGFLQAEQLGTAAAAGGAELAIAAIEGNVLTPLLLSRAGELNTVAVFVSVLMWGWMWDAWGLLLAIPIMVGVKAAADHVDSLKPLGELLGR